MDPYMENSTVQEELQSTIVNEMQDMYIAPAQLEVSIDDTDVPLAPTSLEDAVTEGKRTISEFLKKYTCYDMMEKSGKVVVFDVNITIRLAYYALVEHSIGAAPLWDPIAQRIVGMITVSDFIEVLRNGYQTQSISEIIDKHTICSWRSLIKQLQESPTIVDSLIEQQIPGVRAAAAAASEREEIRRIQSTSDEINQETAQRFSPDHLIPIGPDDTLYVSCQLLRKHNVHRLPIVDQDSQACLGVITHQLLLRYLVNQFREDRPLFNQPIGELGIGTFKNSEREIISATPSTCLIDILKMLSQNGISCVPIVDDDGRAIEIYTRSYVTQLAKHENIENVLDCAVWDLLQGQGKRSGIMYTCSRTDSLHTIFVKFNQSEVHRLICVDDNGILEGIVSLSDLLSYFVALDN